MDFYLQCLVLTIISLIKLLKLLSFFDKKKNKRLRVKKALINANIEQINIFIFYLHLFWLNFCTNNIVDVFLYSKIIILKN